MLLLAAERTRGLAPRPAPFVLKEQWWTAPARQAATVAPAQPEGGASK
jgi:hypothetical protein